MNQQIVVIANGAPYGSESLFNALRLAIALNEQGSASLKLFLMSDAVSAALADALAGRAGPDNPIAAILKQAVSGRPDLAALSDTAQRHHHVPDFHPTAIPVTEPVQAESPPASERQQQSDVRETGAGSVIALVETGESLGQCITPRHNLHVSD